MKSHTYPNCKYAVFTDVSHEPSQLHPDLRQRGDHTILVYVYSSWQEMDPSIIAYLEEYANDLETLIPWRKEGFSQEMEFRDSNRSDRSDFDSSVTYVSIPVCDMKGLSGPSKRLFATFRFRGTSIIKTYEELNCEKNPPSCQF